MMTTIYILSELMLFDLGVTLWVFFGVLFSYFSGYICIAYIYVLNTVYVVTNLPVLFGVAESTTLAMATLDNSVLLPSSVYFLVLIIGLYFGLTVSIFTCSFLIKKLRILDKFSGIHS
jgi:hypothetical protein